jgi:hypothetical protein
MKPLFKTLFGDGRNIAVVAGIVLLDALVAAAGFPRAAALLTPPLLLIGAGWLATR